MNDLCNHYGNQINNIYQGDSAPADAIVSTSKKLNFEISFVYLMKLSKN